MELVRQSPFEVGWLSWRFGGPGDHRLVVAVKASFDLVREGACPISEAQAPVTGDEPWDDDVDASNRYDSDMALLKPSGEWWLTGVLTRREPARELACRARVGDLETRFSVIGDRWWEPNGAMSPAVPFTSMPLRWERCFGGPGVADNSFGAGIAPDRADANGRIRLPNIERAGRLIRSLDERPEPAGAWPIPRRAPSRMRMLGTYDGAYVRDHWPYFPPDMSYAHFLAAPEGQRLRSGFWRGDEEIELTELHPEHPLVRCRLPGVRPRAFVQEAARPDGLAEVGLVLDTIAIDVGEARAFAVWRGSIACRDESFAEFRHLFVMHERLDEGQTPDAYFALFVRELRARIDEEQGLQPEELPEQAEAAGAPEPPLSQPEAEPSIEALLEERRREARAQGWPEELIAELYPADTSSSQSRGDARASIERALALTEQLGLPEATREGLKSAIERLDEAPDEVRKRKRKKQPPPGLFTPQQLRDDVTRRMDAGEPLAGLDLTGADLSLLNLAGVDLRGAILLRADLQHTTLDGATLDGAILDEAKLEGATLRGASLAGASLTLVHADGVDFSSIVLDGAFGERARLAGATFRGAKGTRVFLEECAATGADFEGAVLDEADFPHSDFDGANFQDASLADARFDGATLRRARLDRVRAPKLRASDGADLSDASMHGAMLSEAAFADSVLSRARLTEADLTRAIFSRARMDGAELLAVSARAANFADALLAGASLHGADLLGARFEGASLRDVDLRNANAYEAEFWRADLTGARLDGANLDGTKLA